MAKIEDGLLGSISGKLGPLVVVKRGERSYVRAAPTYSKDSWSERQIQNRQRFKAVNAFCRQHQQQVIIPIWNQLPGNSSGYHQFLKANIAAFDSQGELEDPSMLHFSEGPLPLPFKLRASIQQDQLELSWLNDSKLTTTRHSDELWYMTSSSENINGPFKSDLTRGMEGGMLSLSGTEACTGLYLFFASSDRKAFSPDRFLSI
ncbi:hypothetical protein [Sunxiuqinia sp. sy24]|uniref:hypothetical protein n=1 Tax=Sunxiuqinia sp. sy24 TaxID=3461495 RepID=UPI00404631D8